MIDLPALEGIRVNITPNNQAWRFADFAVDCSSRELRRNGFRIRLQDVPFRILLALLQRPAEIVTREELYRLLWPGDTFVEFDHNLNNAINKLRDALHDSADEPRFIETVPRRGYRFVAPVQPGNAEIKAKASASRSRLKIAVLPFESRNGDSDSEYITEGLTEELISQLGSLYSRGLAVIARNTAVRYTRSSKTLREIGRELEVRYIVAGSARLRDREVRISAELVEAESQTLLWSQSYVRDMSNYHEVERLIAAQVEITLASQLSPRVSLSTAHTFSNNPVANDSYLRGRYCWNKRHEDGLEQSIGWFRKAIQEDAGFGLAYVGLADTYISMATWAIRRPIEIIPLAQAAANKALELDSRLSEAYVPLGFSAFCFEYNQTLGEDFFVQAIQARPSYSLAHHLYGHCLVQISRFDDGLREFALALELDPFSIMTSSLIGHALFCARRYEEAITQCKRAVELDPSNAAAHAYLGLALEKSGDRVEAISVLEKALELSNHLPAFAAILAYGYGAVRKREKARDLLAELKDVEKLRYVPAYWVAAAQLSLGQRQGALESLGRAYENRDPWLVALNVDPRFDDLRETPEYLALLRIMSLSAEGKIKKS